MHQINVEQTFLWQFHFRLGSNVIQISAKWMQVQMWMCGSDAVLC